MMFPKSILEKVYQHLNEILHHRFGYSFVLDFSHACYCTCSTCVFNLKWMKPECSRKPFTDTRKHRYNIAYIVWHVFEIYSCNLSFKRPICILFSSSLLRGSATLLTRLWKVSDWDHGWNIEYLTEVSPNFSSAFGGKFSDIASN
jgi:hypothetical protein